MSGLNASPSSATFLPESEPRCFFSFRDHAPLLELVHLDHGREELEVVAGVRRELLQRERVLREARAAVADAAAQEVRAEPLVEPDALGDLDDVGARRLADVRDLVDERDAGHQEGVRGELDHLGRVHVAADDRRVQLLVERRHRVAVGRLEAPDDDAVRMHELVDRMALGEELGVRGVADVAEAARVEPCAHPRAGPDRHRRLHHEDRPALERGQLLDDAPHARQVGVAGVRGRRVDAHEEEPAAGDGLRVEREGDPLAVALQQLRHLRLVERNLAAPKRVDLLGHDVADHDVVIEIGEARRRSRGRPSRRRRSRSSPSPDSTWRLRAV